MRLLRVIRGWLVGLLRFLLLLPAVLFGRLSWAPPRWLQWLVADLVAGTRWIAARPRLTIALGAGIVVLGGGSYWAYAWWQARPRPIVVQFSVSNPERTVIEDDKRPTPLVVTFDRPVAPLVNVGKDVTSGIRLSPPLAGTWRWASEKRLELTPRDDWAIGSGYTVTLAKSALLREVRLAGQSAGILGVGKETTRFTVNYDKLKLNAYVHSDALPIPKNNTTLILTVAKGVMAARGGKPSEQTIEQTIQVPGLYSLRIDDISGNVATRPNGDPDQVLVVQSSASVGEKEMQKGVTAWVLPIHNPRLRPMVTPEAHAEPYPWSDPSEVSDRILQSSQKLALDPIAA